MRPAPRWRLSSVTTADAGSYTVRVSNSAGTVTSAAATLTVNPAVVAPSITTQPASQTVTAGANVSFHVVATGTAPLSYQWSKARREHHGRDQRHAGIEQCHDGRCGQLHGPREQLGRQRDQRCGDSDRNRPGPLSVAITSPTNGEVVIEGADLRSRRQ